MALSSTPRGSSRKLVADFKDDIDMKLDPRLPLLQDANLRDKVVLLRVDHNVVKKGKIIDQYRIDCTLATMYNVVERGGRPILMTHVGRPYDKKTGTFKCEFDTSVAAVVSYLERKLRIKFAVPEFPTSEKGIQDIDTSINLLIQDLRNRKIGGIYLPNTRWFAGEESKDKQLRRRFALQLAGLADVFVNDAFGSWQPHTSTYDIAQLLPSFAGLCMQNELAHVGDILKPDRPFVAIVAGSKYDTKIGPLKALYKVVDHLILGGVIYNTYLCAKYGIKVKGVEDSDIELARGLVEQDKEDKKLIELPLLVESDELDARVEGGYRTINVQDFKPGKEYNYILDVDPASFDVGQKPREVLEGAAAIFVNAVMGFTPNFFEGTAKMDLVIDQNKSAMKFYGGGDTLQEFKVLHPGLYHAALENTKYYLFTGGGTVLNVIEAHDPYGLETVKALMENGARFGTSRALPA